ncbi:SDR family NAD(P)-dependent oxidoreductase [Mycolicibacterium sp. CBM1]
MRPTGTPLREITMADFDLVFDTGARATLFLMQAAYPILTAAGGASVVNFGSGSGTDGQESFDAYAGSNVDGGMGTFR